MTVSPDKLHDEIELIDYLRIIWKWKYLILAGTLICSLVSAIVSFTMPKTYRVDMVLQSGLLRWGSGGKKIYIESPANIKALIEGGAFNYEIVNHLQNSNRNNQATSLQFKVSIPGNTDIVRISYETVVVNAGINILNHLSDLILKQYSETVKVHKKEYDTKISMKKNNLQYSQDELINVKRTINNYEKRTAELAAEMQSLESSNALLRERKDALIDNRNANDVLVVFLYDNTIQRSLELKNRYKDELFNYMSERDRAKLRLKKIQEQIDTLSKEMEDLKEAKNMIAGITVLQPPSPSPYPIAPKKKLNVMLAAVVGLFAMLFLAFFLEYLSKYKHKENQ